MRKYLAILLCLVIGFTLAGCKGDSGGGDTGVTKDEAGSEPASTLYCSDYDNLDEMETFLIKATFDENGDMQHVKITYEKDLSLEPDMIKEAMYEEYDALAAESMENVTVEYTKENDILHYAWEYDVDKVDIEFLYNDGMTDEERNILTEAELRKLAEAEGYQCSNEDYPPNK